MENRKIKYIKFYQGFSFEGATITWWQDENTISDKVLSKGHSVRLLEQGVMLTGKNGESAFAPFNNVACIVFYAEPKKDDKKK